MGRKKGGKNRPKDQLTLPELTPQVPTQSKRRSVNVLSDSSDTESEAGAASPLVTLQASFKASLRKVEKELNRVHKQLQTLEENFNEVIEVLSKRVEDVEHKQKRHSDKITELEKKLEKLEKLNSEQDQKLNIQERFSRRSNIRIVGYPASEGENCEEIVKAVMEQVGVTNVKIERAHRDGRPTNDRPRHILAKLSFYADKVVAMKNQRRALANQEYFITDDLTKTDLQEKRKWSAQVSQLYTQGVKLRFSAGRWRDGTGKPYSFPQ